MCCQILSRSIVVTEVGFGEVGGLGEVGGVR